MKNKSLKWQVETALKELCRFGESKYKAKVKGKVEGIYSYSTFNTYKKQGIQFTNWAKSKHGCRTLDETKKYIQEYLNEGKDRGLSAWTLKMQASAIAKIYHSSIIELHLKTPPRKRQDIKRSRNKCSHDKHVSDTSNSTIINFSKATGLRRHELIKVTPENIEITNGKVRLIKIKGKGGKVRSVDIIPAYADFVASFINSEPNQPIFCNVSSNIDIHGYRAEYASTLYSLIARPLETLSRSQKYYCRGDQKDIYDKKAMLYVSRQLGHNRINVIASNYLWQVKND